MIDQKTADELMRMMREILERLPPRRDRRARRKTSPRPSRPRPLTVAQLDAINAIQKHGNNHTAAAAELGISRQSLGDRHEAAMRKLAAFDPTISKPGRHRAATREADRRAVRTDDQHDAAAADAA